MRNNNWTRCYAWQKGILGNIYPHNTQKINEENLWKIVSDKKRNQYSPQLIMIRKQFKTNNYYPSKPVSTSDSFEVLEKVLDDINDNIKEKTVKSPLIFGLEL